MIARDAMKVAVYARQYGRPGVREPIGIYTFCIMSFSHDRVFNIVEASISWAPLSNVRSSPSASKQRSAASRAISERVFVCDLARDMDSSMRWESRGLR